MDDPRLPPDIEEYRRLCHCLLDYARQQGGLTDDEYDCIAVIVYYGHLRNKWTAPYGDLDDLAASLAISTFSGPSD